MKILTRQERERLVLDPSKFRVAISQWDPFFISNYSNKIKGFAITIQYNIYAKTASHLNSLSWLCPSILPSASKRILLSITEPSMRLNCHILAITGTKRRMAYPSSSTCKVTKRDSFSDKSFKLKQDKWL
jgi:hypothetical protein